MTELHIPSFTLVSTIFNEAFRLKATIADLKAQTIQPTEIIITDAGSTDDSIEILENWKAASEIPVIIIIEKGCNVARGRNLAIQKAKNKLIVSTDFGCRFHPGWLESLVTPFKQGGVNIVGGTYTVMEREIRSLAAKAAYILSLGYQMNISQWFIPSSRSIAYYKSIWEAVGKYPEWLSLAADDLVFGMKLKAAGYEIYTVDKPYVYWGRHKTTSGYVKEAARYGLGDGEARVNFRSFIVNLAESSFRYFFYSTLFIISILIVFIGTDILWFILLVLFLPGFRPYYGIYKNYLKFKSSKYNVKVCLFAIILLEKTRFSYIKSYIKGCFTRNTEIVKGRHELKRILKK